MLIDRLNRIEEIIEIQNEFKEVKGVPPYNISNWTTSKDFSEEMLSCFDPVIKGNPIDYIYTYNLTEGLKKKILYKLGIKNIDETTAIFTLNNTISIVNVANFLKKHSVKKVCVINPAYFSISQALLSFQIAFENQSMKIENSKYVFPLEEILSCNYDAVWITSPIYSTGVYLDNIEIEKIKYLMEQKIMVIADESFALNKNELVSHFDVNHYFIGIYSPHKSISHNGFKFSVILSHKNYMDFFEQWIDVFCGNLSQSSYCAISHFASENYDLCRTTFEKYMQKARNAVIPILRYSPCVRYDTEAIGSLITLYFNKINFEEAKKKEFIKNLVFSTHTSIYPGYLNGFNKDIGFCFRINLALHENEFLFALRRVLNHLDDLAM